MHQYNYQGWFVSSGFDNRTTEVEPTNKSLTEVVGELRSNWTGYKWIEMPYTVPNIVIPPVEVPQTVTPRQARLALLQSTLLDEVELLLANDKAMQIWWEYSLDIERNHEHIVMMGMALGLTATQLDDLFVLATTL